MIRCLILDDEQYAIDNLADFIRELPYMTVAGTATNGIEALELLNSGDFDLLFMDIQMPGLTGIDLLKIVHIPVILVTAHSQYAFDGFEYDVIDYLLKPFSYTRFLKAVQKAVSVINKRDKAPPQSPQMEKGYLFVNGEHKGKKIKIDFRDIMYIESEKRYVIFHCTAAKHISSMSLRDVEDMLSAYDFARIHNAIIVSMRKVVAIDGNEIILNSSKDSKPYKLPIGITYKARIMELLNN